MEKAAATPIFLAGLRRHVRRRKPWTAGLALFGQQGSVFELFSLLLRIHHLAVDNPVESCDFQKERRNQQDSLQI